MQQKTYSEKYVQSKIIQSLKSAGWIVKKNLAVSVKGWPDLEAYKDARTIFIECKSTGKKPTPLQSAIHERIRKEGFEVYTIDNPDDLKIILK